MTERSMLSSVLEVCRRKGRLFHSDRAVAVREQRPTNLRYSPSRSRAESCSEAWDNATADSRSYTRRCRVRALFDQGRACILKLSQDLIRIFFAMSTIDHNIVHY